jgi:hypothetical protein
VRVYLPATVPALRALLDSGTMGSAPLTAFAVTPALREWYVDEDAESLEYAALLAAARAALRLLDDDPAAPRRRVVVVADVPDADVTPRPDLDRAVVRLGQPVVMDQVVAAHLDDAAAEDTVAKAARSVLDADLGSADAQFVVDGAEGYDLGWYATQELGPLVELL